jgi:hypothetical protein
MEEYRTTIEQLDAEINRVKLWTNENGFHAGTSVNYIMRQYRTELKKLRRLMWENLPENDHL